MKIDAHYLLNLKRSKIRLGAWLGYQESMGFDFSNLTVFEACDLTHYQTIGEMAKCYRESLWRQGLSFPKHLNLYPEESQKSKGYYANLISKLLMLIRIRNVGEGDWVMMWEDDVVLKQPYTELLALDIPETADMVSFHSGGLPDTDTKHERLPYMKGCLDARANQMLLINRKGAEQIIDIYQRKQLGYELEQFLAKHHKDLNAWTSIENMGRFLHIKGNVSDIANKYNEDIGITFNTVSLKHTSLKTEPMGYSLVEFVNYEESLL